MKAEIRSRIAPPTAVTPQQMNPAQAKEKEAARDSTAEDKIDFKNLVANSNAETARERASKIKGDLTADNKEDFFRRLEEETNKDIKVPKNKLDKDDFLKLFVEQLKHQDPLNPDDGAELAAKLAQFNGVEQMVAMNKSLTELASSQNTDRSLQMTNFIGKEMTINGGRFKLEQGKMSESDFSMRNGASNTTLQIRDESGRLVFEKELGNKSSGSHKLSWDGKNRNGVTMGDGVYSYNIIATDLDGQTVPVEMNSKVRVTGVDVMDKQGTLYTNFGPVKLSDIKAVGEQGFERNAKSNVADVSAPTDPNQVQEAASGELSPDLAANIAEPLPPPAEGEIRQEPQSDDAEVELNSAAIPTPDESTQVAQQ
jgi:flagellar basal-body rod modification protein FlgD